MGKKLKYILVAYIVVALLVCAGCGKQSGTPEETKSDTVEHVMQKHTVVEIGDVTDAAAAEVTITTPDLAAIYLDLLTKNADVDMSADEIAKAIDGYAENEEFFAARTVTTSLERDGDHWKLSSDECIDEVVREQVNNLMIQMINNIGTIEVEDISGELK